MFVDVAVIVVTFNSEEHVEALLDSLPSAMGDLRYRVVVVDNGSTDTTLSVLSARSDCVLVRSINDGYAAGINRAVTASPTSSDILVLNPDTTLDPGCVPNMRAVLKKPGVGIVAPLVREHNGNLSPTLRREPSLLRVGGLSFTRSPLFAERIEDGRAYQNEHPVDWAVGAILLIDRECYEALGGFDESYFLYSEETDFSLSARDAGWATVFTPTATAMHIGGGSGETVMTHTMKIVNRVRLYRRRAGGLRGAIYFALTIAVEVRRGIFGRRESWPTVVALLCPSRRPSVLGASTHLLPR